MAPPWPITAAEAFATTGAAPPCSASASALWEATNWPAMLAETLVGLRLAFCQARATSRTGDCWGYCAALGPPTSGTASTSCTASCRPAGRQGHSGAERPIQLNAAQVKGQQRGVDILHSSPGRRSLEARTRRSGVPPHSWHMGPATAAAAATAAVATTAATENGLQLGLQLEPAFLRAGCSPTHICHHNPTHPASQRRWPARWPRAVWWSCPRHRVQRGPTRPASGTGLWRSRLHQLYGPASKREGPPPAESPKHVPQHMQLVRLCFTLLPQGRIV